MKHPPLSFTERIPPHPFTLNARITGSRVRRHHRTARPFLLAQNGRSHVPLSQLGYVIFDFVANPVSGLHRWILAAVTIAHWHSHAMVHLRPGAFNRRLTEALARPPSLHLLPPNYVYYFPLLFSSFTYIAVHRLPAFAPKRLCRWRRYACSEANLFLWYKKIYLIVFL